MLAFEIAVGSIALVFVIYLTKVILKHDQGTQEMQEISNATRKGALAFLKREYQILTIFIAILFAVLALVINVKTGVTYLVGTACSILAGFLGMQIATKANARTAEACKKSIGSGLKVSFSSGAVMGFSVVGLGLIGITILYIIFDDQLLAEVITNHVQSTIRRS